MFSKIFTKNILISLVVFLALTLIGGYYLYNSILAKSKLDGASIISRSISKVIPQPISNTSKVLKIGEFLTLDPAHYAKGSVIANQNGDNVAIDFSSDFQTNPDGPDLYVWLVKKQDIKNIALGGLSSKAGDYLDLGALQNKSGAQSYQVTSAEFANYDYAVVIWCRAFGVQFSNAILK